MVVGGIKMQSCQNSSTYICRYKPHGNQKSTIDKHKREKESIKEKEPKYNTKTSHTTRKEKKKNKNELQKQSLNNGKKWQ